MNQNSNFILHSNSKIEIDNLELGGDIALNLLKTTKYPVNNPILKKLIKYYWLIESQLPIEVNHKLLPVSNIDFILNLSSPIRYLKEEKLEIVSTGFHFNGITDRYFWIKQTGILRVLGISFFPIGLFPILKIPISEFKDNTIEIDSVISNFTETVIGKIDNTQSIYEIINIIENQLIQNVDLSLMPRKEVFGIFEVFNSNINDFSIKSLCEQYGINQRKLERVFNKYMGVSPKLFYRINRFQEIINYMQKNNSENLTRIVYDNNYYDQMHFIKDFKLFAGSTPIEFINQRKSVKQITKY